MPTLRTPTPSFRAPTRNPSSSLEQCQGFTSLCYGFRGPHGKTAVGEINPDEERRHSKPSHRHPPTPSFRAPTRNPSSSLEQCLGFTSLCYGFRGPHGMTAEGAVNPELYANTPNSHAVIPGSDPESIFQS